MEYLVDFTIDIPDGTSSDDIDRRTRAEAERVDALEQGRPRRSRLAPTARRRP